MMAALVSGLLRGLVGLDSLAKYSLRAASGPSLKKHHLVKKSGSVSDLSVVTGSLIGFGYIVASALLDINHRRSYKNIIE